MHSIEYHGENFSPDLCLTKIAAFDLPIQVDNSTEPFNAAIKW